MSGALFMPLWTDAYLGDTRHLSTLQHGAYLLLLMAMWRNGGTLPNEEKRLARTAGLSLDKWRKASPEVMELFEVEDGLLTQKRLKLELEKSLGLAQKRALAGSAGGKAKWLKNNDSDVANAKAEPKQKSSLQDPSPSPTPSEEKKEVVVGDPDAVFRAAAAAAAAQAEPRKVYAIEEGKFRITVEDMDKLIESFPHINVKGAVQGCSGWALDKWGDRWWSALKGWLQKQDEAARKDKLALQVKAEAAAKQGTKPQRSIV